MPINNAIEEPATYDLFVSYARADSKDVMRIVDTLRQAGLRLWLDTSDLEPFEGVTDSIRMAISESKACLIWYSNTYLTRPACQWELICAINAIHRANKQFLQRLLVVNPLPTFDHIHPLPLRDQQFDPAVIRKGNNLREFTKAVVQRVTTLKGKLGPVDTTKPSGRGPSGRANSPSFIGRMPELFAIHSHLWAEDYGIISGVYSGRSVQVVGLAGTGKSFLAEEYAMRFAGSYVGGVFSLSAGGFNDVTKSWDDVELERVRQTRWAQLALELGVDVKRDHDQDALDVEVRIALEQVPGNYLWIVDDLPGSIGTDTAQRWFAPSKNGRTLITTKSRKFAQLCPAIDLGGLPNNDALRLLTMLLPASDDGELQAAKAICQRLANHPMALAITGAAISNRGGARAYRSYAIDLERDAVTSLENSAALDIELPTGHEKSIIATLRRSIDSLSDDARDILTLLAFGAATMMPDIVVRQAIAQARGYPWRESRDRFETAVMSLTNTALVRRNNSSNPGIEAHSLVIEVYRALSKGRPVWQAMNHALGSVLTQQLALAPNALVRGRLDSLLPHARVFERFNNGSESLPLTVHLAEYMRKLGVVAETLNVYDRAIKEFSHGSHPRSLISKAFLGYVNVLLQAGLASKAEEWSKKSLGLHSYAFGEAHPRYLDAMVESMRCRSFLSDDETIEVDLRELITLWTAQTSDIKYRRRAADLALIYAGLLKRRQQEAFAFPVLFNALHQNGEFSVEGNPTRLELRFAFVSVLLELRWIRGNEEEPRPNAFGHAKAGFEEASSVWGLTHRHTADAVELLARCYEAEGNTHEAHCLRLGYLAKSEAELKVYPERFAVLSKRVQQGWPVQDSEREEVQRGIAILDELSANSVSMDAMDENSTRKAEEEFGADSWVTLLFSRANQLMGMANDAAKLSDFDVAVLLSDDALRHLLRTRGQDDEKTLSVTRSLSQYLLYNDDPWRARGVLNDLLEYYSERDGDCSEGVAHTAWHLLLTFDVEKERQIARTILRNYLAWILRTKPRGVDSIYTELRPRLKQKYTELYSPFERLRNALTAGQWNA